MRTITNLFFLYYIVYAFQIYLVEFIVQLFIDMNRSILNTDIYQAIV